VEAVVRMSVQMGRKKEGKEAGQAGGDRLAGLLLTLAESYLSKVSA
jgi:hypothetical protein